MDLLKKIFSMKNENGFMKRFELVRSKIIFGNKAYYTLMLIGFLIMAITLIVIVRISVLPIGNIFMMELRI